MNIVDKILYNKYETYINEGYCYMPYEEYKDTYCRSVVHQDMYECSKFLTFMQGINVLEKEVLIKTVVRSSYCTDRVPDLAKYISKNFKRVGNLI